METAFVFPGQGSQHVGMGRELYEGFPDRLGSLYERANEALGFDIQTLIFDGPEEELTLTENAQPAILLDSVAKFELLTDRESPDVAAGHSLGEYSALVCAGVLHLEDALRLVRNRGRYMQEAVPVGEGAMAAIMKLDRAQVETICERTGAEIANINGPTQIAISGRRDAVRQAQEEAAQAGGRAIELDVSAPFHSSLMQPAEDRLRPEIERVAFGPPAFPVVSTVSGEPETDPERIRALMAEQITAQVRWAEDIARMIDRGLTRVVEVGPGQVLTRLTRRIGRDLDVRTFAQAYDDPG